MRRLICDHALTLRKYGLITDRPVVHGKGVDGSIIEIFEWTSEEAIRCAHSIPDMKNLWKSMEEVADFVPLASLSEAHKPFAHFEPL
jgi:hypothetical protein